MFLLANIDGDEDRQMLLAEICIRGCFDSSLESIKVVRRKKKRERIICTSEDQEDEDRKMLLVQI